jgi:hypothetical protein
MCLSAGSKIVPLFTRQTSATLLNLSQLDPGTALAKSKDLLSQLPSILVF